MKYLLEDKDLSLSKFDVLYFYATWLKYHKKFDKMITTYSNKEVNFTAIDVDKFKNLVTRWKIESIPTLVLLYNGKEVKKIEGMLLTSAFNASINSFYKKYNNGESNDK